MGKTESGLLTCQFLAPNAPEGAVSRKLEHFEILYITKCTIPLVIDIINDIDIILFIP